MRIYLASQSFYPYICGVSTHLINLEKEMVKKGNEVVGVHLRHAGEPSADENLKKFAEHVTKRPATEGVREIIDQIDR
ncbi:MAG: hypothetical protein KAI18_01570 [Candidatus Aenigmarchaeota archaeon]|nr:hypothetical protein [Candidatus Aenigmarchaeota archaeon]